jgi:cystathionine beta-lyase/cystathionine gamma-synthase
MEAQQKNAFAIVDWLNSRKQVRKVYYVGLPSHPGYEVSRKQSSGYGSMISFHVDTPETAVRILRKVQLIQYAESLGGVESLITYPMLQTHADVPVAEREAKGINATLLRLSVGIEYIDDLIADLTQAFDTSDR